LLEQPQNRCQMPAASQVMKHQWAVHPGESNLLAATLHITCCSER
jgi:hypothetical protein